MPRALISVYEKTGLIEFAHDLIERGWEIVASGGTERALRDEGLAVTPVEQLTQVPEMLGARVKTLHPAIHAGILARDRADDMEELAQQGFAPINMVVCNLYPFIETVSQPGVTLQDAIEQIDIGGVTLIRAAAKNFFRVVTVCDPADYGRVLAAIKAVGDTDLALRRELAIKAFALTRDYDTAIYAYLYGDLSMAESGASALPAQLSYSLHAVDHLRYGENPHQSGAFYARNTTDTPLGATVLGGKQLSYNNILDIDAAWRTVSAFNDPTVVIVKHLTPTGIATADTITAAYTYALESDPVSAFGGIIAVNRIVDETFVQMMGTLFVEAIAAPGFTQGAQTALAENRKNCRLLKVPQAYDTNQLDIRTVHKGFLVQRLDAGDPEGTGWRTVSARTPSADELAAMQYAWKAVQHVKSNAIVIAKAGYTLGVGGGLPNRLDAVAIAVKRAGARAHGAALASDAFFPFPDGVEAAIAAGVTAIVQPGGSIRDTQVIETANRANVAMVFTGTRHFRH